MVQITPMLQYEFSYATHRCAFQSPTTLSLLQISFLSHPFDFTLHLFLIFAIFFRSRRSMLDVRPSFNHMYQIKRRFGL